MACSIAYLWGVKPHGSPPPQLLTAGSRGEVLKEEASNKGVILSCWESVFWNAAMPIVCFCVLFLVSFLFMLFEKNF